MDTRKFVAYYRVSTQKQGTSGLGLESQKKQVAAFVGNGQIILEFTEIESGKKADRLQLSMAIAAAKLEGAKLIIAKLDRLSRDIKFIFALRDSGVQFVCADMPDANTLTIGIFAVMAQHERETISKRTKDGLAVKRAQLALIGGKLGTPANLNAAAREKGRRAIVANARKRTANVQATEIATLHRQQGATLQNIADLLNDLKFKTVRGVTYTPTTVMYLLNRAGVKNPKKSVGKR